MHVEVFCRLSSWLQDNKRHLLHYKIFQDTRKSKSTQSEMEGRAQVQVTADQPSIPQEVNDMLNEFDFGCAMAGIVMILRGVVGAGKTTLAKNVATFFENNFDLSCEICSADAFFVDFDGQYRFSASLLQNAHDFCKGRFLLQMERCVNLIIIDNTNLKLQDYEFYKTQARKHGYNVEVVQIKCESVLDAQYAAARSVHVDVNYPAISKLNVLNTQVDHQAIMVDMFKTW